MSVIADVWMMAQQQKQQQEEAEQQALAEQNDLKSVMDNAAGRRVIRRILNHTGILSGSFSPEQRDVTAFREGRRDVGLWLNAQLLSLPDLYLLLMTEEIHGQPNE